jgi:serine/threonine protein kinase
MAGLEGTKLGAYELLERIGGGGMAEVYRARQTTAFGREVAIKVIRAGYSENQTFRERFLREAQAISKLSHPHILPLIEFGEEGETLFLVMPLAREGTLRDLMKQRNGPLPLEEAIPIFTQLCDAVHYAHEQGIVHRDLKPQNVLMQRRAHVLLADFGIARDSAESEHLTATGAGIGTVEYMAPEQALGQADARSDIYSLGIVLYQLITGLVPYSGSTPFQIIMRHSNEPLPDPRAINPGIPTELVEVLKTALAKDPNRRFQSAQALGRAVQQVRPDAAAPALPGPQVSSPPPISRSHPTPVAPDAPPATAPTERLNEQQEPPRGQTWAGTSADAAFPPPPPVSPPPTPTWAGGAPAFPGHQGPPPIGGWAASQTPPAPDYEQPTWSTSSGVRQPVGGPPPVGRGGNGYGQISGPPPGIGVAPYAPAPERRRSTRLIVIIAGVLALVILLSAGAYAFSQGVFSGNSSNGIAQQPTNTTQPAATSTTAEQATNTTQPTATNTAVPTATNTPRPTPTRTPKPTPTKTPKPTATATPVPVFKVTGINATVSPGNWNYSCSNTSASQVFTFNATIFLNGGTSGGTVTYHWIRSDGATSGSTSVNVSASTTSITVSTTWMLFSGVPNGSYWEQVIVTSPNSISSNKPTFTVSCT